MPVPPAVCEELVNDLGAASGHVMIEGASGPISVFAVEESRPREQPEPFPWLLYTQEIL